MSTGQDTADTEWARFLRHITDQDGWSVARLAREAGVDRGTIFRWMRGGGERVTVDSVRRIAEATGSNLDAALRAAGGLPTTEVDDYDEIEFEIAFIQRSDLPDAQKKAMIRVARDLQRRQRDELNRIRERQRAERRLVIQGGMDIARGET